MSDTLGQGKPLYVLLARDADMLTIWNEGCAEYFPFTSYSRKPLPLEQGVLVRGLYDPATEQVWTREQLDRLICLVEENSESMIAFKDNDELITLAQKGDA